MLFICHVTFVEASCVRSVLFLFMCHVTFVEASCVRSVLFLFICHVTFVATSCVRSVLFHVKSILAKLQSLDHLLIMILKTIRCRERETFNFM